MSFASTATDYATLLLPYIDGSLPIAYINRQAIGDGFRVAASQASTSLRDTPCNSANNPRLSPSRSRNSCTVLASNRVGSAITTVFIVNFPGFPRIRSRTSVRL
jgi:hypothetical protein